MSVIDTLVTNRSEADRRRVEQLTVLGWDNMTEEQRAEWLAGLKGAYNYTDLNRVTAALDYLAARLNESGYAVPGYQKHIVPHGWNTGKNLKNVVENGSFASNGTGGHSTLTIQRRSMITVYL